jgi:hypothetical protein
MYKGQNSTSSSFEFIGIWGAGGGLMKTGNPTAMNMNEYLILGAIRSCRLMGLMDGFDKVIKTFIVVASYKNTEIYGLTQGV